MLSRCAVKVLSELPVEIEYIVEIFFNSLESVPLKLRAKQCASMPGPCSEFRRQS